MAGRPLVVARGDSPAPAQTDGRIEFDPAHLALVRDALAKVTRPGGTSPAVGKGAAYGIAGKSGTAQVARLQLDEKGERIKNEDLPEKLRDHAWFAGYAPSDDPLVAVAALVENGGSGGRVAGPIVRELMDAWLVSVRAAHFCPGVGGRCGAGTVGRRGKTAPAGGGGKRRADAFRRRGG